MPQVYLKKLQEAGQTINPLFNFLGVNIEFISKEKIDSASAIPAWFHSGRRGDCRRYNGHSGR